MTPVPELTALLASSQAYELHRGRVGATGAGVLVKLASRQPVRAADVAALKRECELISGLSCAGVLQSRALERSSGAMLVMADLGGELLSSLVARERPELAQVLAIGIQIAQALAELHRLGMVHNGIRPSAVMCSGERAWLIDYGDATDSAATHQPASAPSMPAQRLVYASPEQTGRMERASDHRSDLYSLGVVLYELLIGAPPFRSDDALELIHSHIARAPIVPIDMDRSIAPPVSDIVMKLLAKEPQERYQSAEGLIDDLGVCSREWAARRNIAAFALGRRDIGDHLTILPRLYGRESEVAVLQAAFERACRPRAGRPSMLLVAGYPGIGKTALIQELYKPIVRKQGYFVSGKFDQVVRSIPFGALIQAFRGLVRQLLTESEARLQQWQSALGHALGANGGVLAEVIPEIEFIIGKQAPAVPLGPTESVNRFQRVFQGFLAAVAQPAHPLVIFLDDLQWADAATLGLLEPLLGGAEIGNLLLIGAYRDTELDSAHRLTRTLAALEAAGVELQRVPLGPLRPADVSALIRDTLHSDAEHAAPLAQLVSDKTAGNPFFVIQFLKALERAGHFSFDAARTRWTYRIEAIARAPLPDDVGELMTHNIQRLTAKSQYALTLAACIGNRFDLGTLEIISEQSRAAVADDLELAVSQGLIVPVVQREDAAGSGPGAPQSSPAYSFLHDRVQQAAYALIADERKAMLHLTIGRLIHSRATPEQLEHKLFDILHHLNRGRGLIRTADERLAAARLNLGAGRRAKASTAHDAALEYFQAGLSLLDQRHWRSDHELCFALHLEAAQSQYLCGNFDIAQRQCEVLLQRAVTDFDRARVYRLRSLQYENMARYADALASTRQGLLLLGVSLPESVADEETALGCEIDVIASLLGEREIASLIDLPVMTDPKTLVVMSMLTDIWASAFLLGDPTLARLISATLVRLSLVYGNAAESAYGYVTHAITVGPVRGDYRLAYEFGTLALAVNHRFEDARLRAKIYQQFHAHVNFWCQPWATCIPYAREAGRSGLESGDFLYAAYGTATETWSAFLATEDLAQFVHAYVSSVALIEKLKNRGFADSVKIILNWARALQGQTAGWTTLSDGTIDENEYLRTYHDNPFFKTFHAVAKLHLCCLLGTPAQALQAARVAGSTVHHVPGTMWPIIYEFWSSLALAEGLADTGEEERKTRVAQIARSRASFDVLAQNCPQNFLCPSLLLAAEVERIEGREHAASMLYVQAIEYAARPGLIQHRALANELCAKFHLACGRSSMAAMFMERARDGYAQWGAAAKVEQLTGAYVELFAQEASYARVVPDRAHATVTTERDAPAADGLDLYSVMKAAQAVAAEVELDRLLATLMRIAIENAGAERCCLVLERDEEPLVYAAEATQASGQTPSPGIALGAARHVPASIVNFVRRTSESIVLSDAPSDDRFGSDPYVTQHKPRSAMCVAVQKQGRLVGVLYLENRALAGAFTSDRIRIMQMLAAEAAISLENARLFDGLKREIRERMQAQHELSTALAQVERLKEDLEAENVYLRGDLIANVSHDLRTPLVSMRGYLEMLCSKGESLAPETRRSYLEIALRQSEHLATLIEELFELAKLDFKGLKIEREAFQLGELTFDVLQKFQLAADCKQVALRVEAPQSVPSVHADLSMIERVLDNLIGNALQHTPSGGTVGVGVRWRARECARCRYRQRHPGGGAALYLRPFLSRRHEPQSRLRRRRPGAGHCQAHRRVARQPDHG